MLDRFSAGPTAGGGSTPVATAVASQDKPEVKMADDSTDATVRTPLRETAGIARGVLILAGAGILAISMAALIGGWVNGRQFETTQLVFNALLPLFGTWVGTVLAYYFSKQNFESASQSVERMVTLTTEQKLGKIVVEKEMLRSGQITAVTIPAGKTEKDITLQDLAKLLRDPVTRIPILDSTGAVKYIVHQSGLWKFIAEHATAGNPAAIATLTLDDLVKDAILKDWVSNIVFIPASVSVAEAKKRMEERKGCQDLIVTQNGGRSEPMLGWMTNTDIGRLSKA
jgi:hypothetical protein